MATTKLPCANEINLADLEEPLQSDLKPGSHLDSSDSSFNQMISFSVKESLQDASKSYCFDFANERPLETT